MFFQIACCKLLLPDMLGTVQVISSATGTVDADNAGTSGEEVGRLQGYCQ